MSVLLLIVFVFGLLVGSFLNVCIYRIPRHESIAFPGSHCPSCGVSIKAYDLVPVVSFLFLKGRCRSCKGVISWRYPFVELFTAVLLVVQAWRWGASLSFAFFGMLTVCLIIITMVDVDLQQIPDGLTLFLVIVGAIYLFVLQVPQYGALAWKSSLIGFALGGGLLLLIAIISKGGMGGGDIKLMAALGLWFGWEKLLVLMMISFVGGAIISLFLLLFGLKSRKDAIPFGPFIALAAYATSLYGEELLQLYQKMIF